MARSKRKRQEQIEAARINLILVMLAAWMAAQLIALWALFLRVAPDPGLGNSQMGIGWLGIGGTIGFAIWAVSLGLPKDNGVRRMALAPLALSLAGCVPVWIGWV